MQGVELYNYHKTNSLSISFTIAMAYGKSVVQPDDIAPRINILTSIIFQLGTNLEKIILDRHKIRYLYCLPTHDTGESVMQHYQISS